jgi:hypothetical protein
LRFPRHAGLRRFQAQADNHAPANPIDPARCGGADLAWEDMPYSMYHADWLRRGLYGELWLERIYATNIDCSLDHVRRRLYDGAVAGAQPRFALRDARARDASGESAKAVKTTSRTSRCSGGGATIGRIPPLPSRPVQVVGRSLGAVNRAGDPLAFATVSLLCCLDGLVLVFACAHASTIAALVRAVRCSEPRQHCGTHGAATGVPIQSTLIRASCMQPRGFYDTAGADLVHASIRVHFRCPVGALIDYAGMPKSPYHSPTTGRVTAAYFGRPPNSSAARCERNQRNIIDRGRGRNKRCVQVTRFPARANQNRSRP